MTALVERRNMARSLWGRLAAAQAVGVSFRQLDYWERTGMMTSTIPPLGSGSRARMDTECVIAAGVLAVLINHTLGRSGRPPGRCTPTWDQITTAVDRGGRFELNPRTGEFDQGPLTGADCIIVVDIDRISERVEAALVKASKRGGSGTTVA